MDVLARRPEARTDARRCLARATSSTRTSAPRATENRSGVTAVMGHVTSTEWPLLAQCCHPLCGSCPSSREDIRRSQYGSEFGVVCAILRSRCKGRPVNNTALWLITFGLACVVIAIVGGGLSLTAKEMNIPRINSVRRQIILGLVGTVVALCGGLLLPGVAPEVRPPRPISANPINTVPIKIDRVSTPVPRCATFGGQGDVPTDKYLWLAILTSGSEQYFFRPAAVNPGEHNWVVKKVTIGSKDTSLDTLFTIYAVLVDNVTNQQLRQGRFAGGIPTLPSNFQKVDQIEVKRGTENSECK
jgi:hypothetical protein